MKQSKEGVLVKVSEEFYYARVAMGGLIGKVRDFFAVNNELGPQDFRDLTNLSRKFAIPVLEYLEKDDQQRQKHHNVICSTEFIIYLYIFFRY